MCAPQAATSRRTRSGAEHVSGPTRNLPFSRERVVTVFIVVHAVSYHPSHWRTAVNMVRPTLRLSQSLRPRRVPQSHPRTQHQTRFASTNPGGNTEAAQKKAQDALATAQKYAGDAAEATKKFLGPAGEKAAGFFGGAFTHEV